MYDAFTGHVVDPFYYENISTMLSRDRTNISSVFGKDEPGEDQAWLITYDCYFSFGDSVFS